MKAKCDIIFYIIGVNDNIVNLSEETMCFETELGTLVMMDGMIKLNGLVEKDKKYGDMPYQYYHCALQIFGIVNNKAPEKFNDNGKIYIRKESVWKVEIEQSHLVFRVLYEYDGEVKDSVERKNYCEMGCE